MATLLSGYLAEVAGSRFEWGRRDCLLFAADWIKRCRGVDPAAPWRGTYVSRRGCLELLARHGGVETLVQAAMANAGIKTADNPSPGDVALVIAPVRHGKAVVNAPVGAIAVGSSSFAVLTIDCGLVIAPLRPIVSWKV